MGKSTQGESRLWSRCVRTSCWPWWPPHWLSADKRMKLLATQRRRRQLKATLLSPLNKRTADSAQQGKDMVCVCKRIKKPANVKCNRTVEIEEPPQDPKTLKELVQCTPGGYNLTQAQRLLLRKEAKQRQEMELQQEKFEVEQVKLMTTCLSGHCEPDHDLNSGSFFTPPPPVEPMECYDRCHDNQCKPIWKNPAQGWEDWYACVQQCVSGCYIIQ